MSTFAIKVDGLGKKYMIQHKVTGRRYVALRDVLAEKARGLFRRSSMANKSGQTREEFWALKNVSFEIKHGEAVGIIGRNGAGKSTLLKLLSRITEPSAGSIRLRGRLSSLLEVGTGFHPELTGRENIFLNGAVLGMSRAEIKRKFDEIVDFAEVEKFLDTPVKRYSSGMYTRLAFAVAAHLEPEILVVDEVLAVGDSAFQKRCLGKMQDVSKSGRTVIFVSHNMEAILRLCSHCVYLVKGEMQARGNPADVIKIYSEFSRNVDSIVDLRPLPRRLEGSGKAQLISLRSLHDEANAPWCYEYGTPLKFAVEFSIHAALEKPEIGYAVFTLTGTELISSTTFQDCPMERIEPGRYSMVVTIPDLILNPGTYVLALGIASMGYVADHVAEVTQIEIIPSKESLEKELRRILAPLTPRTSFELKQIS